ncbi:phytanoyl-CoA dioxygenase [Pseudomonas tohonis]|uniref:Phytanoyl-CoA dioxygenase n=1 Tax=Pseudomonas tohonis TaxID=2725477 RepID=A0A6J4E5C5_9PSED|nr:phytanoyl-CoA dioxygenase family protein [Pseudomonas tohonis]BCG24479.1 phytanoyl-CoA dioxygenase [Pseudomonas tohonis]GJN52163.1 phytanoyl-CoA dioxygenase [Pseudomonas tohonis]
MANLYTDGHGNHPGAGRSTTPLQAIDKRRPLRVLSEADWQHWTRKGYVIVRNAVSAAEADAVVEMLWRFQEMDPHDPTTWYRPQLREHRMTELNNTGMVEVYNHQSLWDTRQNRRVYDAFVDIWDREDLWVAIDRANLNPPNKAARAAGRKDGFIHFDVDVSRRPLPIAAQGVLSLAPQDEEVGGFQCVPGIFAEIEQWWARQPQGANPFKPDIGEHRIENISLEKGDLLIFNSLLAHGVRPNRSKDRVRLAQYISMFPADFDNEPLRQARIHTWAAQTHPLGDPFPGDPREYERRHFARAELSPHGRRLLGLEPWP